ncbi:MAG: ATP-binding protein [Bacteroidota bacterium]
MELPNHEEAYETKYDLMNCEAEPLHQIRYIQDHVVLIACTLTDRIITNVTANAATVFSKATEDILGVSIDCLLPQDALSIIDKGLARAHFGRINPIHAIIEQQAYNLVAHTHEDLLIIEVEPRVEEASGWQQLAQIDEAIQRMQGKNEVEELLQVTVDEVRAITGYDRVMLYCFDEDYNGQVVTESKIDDLEAFKGLHYPASDIPKQARDLYFLNKTRIVTDVQGSPSRILPSHHPLTRQPLNLTYVNSRGVSPIHIEYLMNMGVRATMSVAIIVEKRLWGLIACHHYTSGKFIDFRVRRTVGFLGQILSGYVSLQLIQRFRNSELSTNLKKSQLIEQLNRSWDMVQGLLHGDISADQLFDSIGVAMLLNEEWHTKGETPNIVELMELVEWLRQQNITTHFATHELSAIYPAAQAFKGKASGILAIQIAKSSNDCLIWFRPEESYTVEWGGRPEKVVVETEAGMRVSPRKSFAKWSQQVDGKAKPWSDADIQTALSMRNDILDFVFQKYDELKRVNEELQESYKELESFSYTISHDLRSPLRGIDGFAEILSEDYEDQLDDYGKSLLKIIQDNTQKMNMLIDDILKLSRLGKAHLAVSHIEIYPMLQDIISDLLVNEDEKRDITINISADLPDIEGDRTMIYQLFQNLLSNAIKYTRKAEKAKIDIYSETANLRGFARFFVADNGIGIEPRYQAKIFEVFSRLVTENEFEGTGIGLSIVKKIVQSHKGDINMKSEVGKGSTFITELPIAP